jgi:hypothetical protein
MDVQLYANSRRPGVGVRPRRESQRPLLPQHARHCPVLEAGSAAGFLVYPPLTPQEAFHVGYLGEGRYSFVYYANPTGGRWEGVFSVTFVLPIGGVGTSREEVAFLIPGVPESRENAVLMARTFIATEDLGTPAGAVTLRGAWNFRTPPGWDTIYTPVFNMIERPVAPMLVIRVETDWYAHDSEFRYVLAPGEGISGSHSLPIGQVLFVPREEITLRDCAEEDLEAIEQSRQQFSRAKSALTRNTAYGLPYSPHYFQASRARGATVRENAPGMSATLEPASEPAAAEPSRRAVPSRSGMEALPVRLAPSARKIGRNEPCPCGSGRKYKKCHGEAE